MTTLELIADWLESTKIEELSVHYSVLRPTNSDEEDSVRGTIRYRHTRLIDAGNSTHYPEWLFYEIAYISEYEASWYVGTEKHTLNIHDPKFFEKLMGVIDKITKNIKDSFIKPTTQTHKVAMKTTMFWDTTSSGGASTL